MSARSKKLAEAAELEEDREEGEVTGIYRIALAAIDKNLKEKRATRANIEKFNRTADTFSSQALQLHLEPPRRK